MMKIGAHAVGGGARCFVLAEAGVNHNGDVSLAEKLVDAAADAGADCVKFQTFTPQRLVSSSADKAAYQKETTGGGSQKDMLEKLALPDDAWPRLMARAQAKGIAFMSTPFDEVSADLLVKMDVPALKIGSGELTNHMLLDHVARARLPLLLSTGMATLDEVRAALDVVHAASHLDSKTSVALFHCVSSYPANASDCNLRAMATMRAAFDVPVGFSDHTLGVDVALAAVAMGAELIEKHITLDTNMAGPDHRASLAPNDFARMVRGIRDVESALGDGVKAPRPAEIDVRAVARRSLFWARDVAAGAMIAREDIEALRPAGGMEPGVWRDLLGRTLSKGVKAGALVRAEELS